MTCKTYLNKTVKKFLIYKELQDNWEKKNFIAKHKRDISTEEQVRMANKDKNKLGFTQPLGNCTLTQQ